MSTFQRKLVAALILTTFSVLVAPSPTLATGAPAQAVVPTAVQLPGWGEGWRALTSWFILICSGYGAVIDPIGGNGNSNNDGGDGNNDDSGD